MFFFLHVCYSALSLACSVLFMSQKVLEGLRRILDLTLPWPKGLAYFIGAPPSRYFAGLGTLQTAGAVRGQTPYKIYFKCPIFWAYFIIFLFAVSGSPGMSIK